MSDKNLLSNTIYCYYLMDLIFNKCCFGFSLFGIRLLGMNISSNFQHLR